MPIAAFKDPATSSVSSSAHVEQTDVDASQGLLPSHPTALSVGVTYAPSGNRVLFERPDTATPFTAGPTTISGDGRPNLIVPAITATDSVRGASPTGPADLGDVQEKWLADGTYERWTRNANTSAPLYDRTRTIEPVDPIESHLLGEVTPATTLPALVDQQFYHADFGCGLEDVKWDSTLDKSTVDFLRTVDPSKLFDFADQGAGTGAGGMVRQFADYSVIDAGRYGYKTDSDGRTPGSGQDNYAILQGIVDSLPDTSATLSIDGFDTTNLARVGGYVIKLPRTESGVWARISQKIDSRGKNVVFRSERSVHGLWNENTPDNQVLDFAQSGQGSEVGVQGLALRGGGIRFIGSTNGQGIVAEDLLIMDAPGAALETIDQYEVDNPNPTPPGSFPGASRNVTQFNWRRITTVSCQRSIHLRATTYSKVSIEYVRCIKSEDSPILIQSAGVDFRHLEFIGVSEDDRDNKAFIHIKPDDYHATDDISITGHVRQGSEDTTTTIDAAGTVRYFSPPRQAIIIGDPNQPTDQLVSRLKFGDSNNNFNITGFSDVNNSDFEMDYAFHITATPTSMFIDGVFVNPTVAVIDETHYLGENIPAINRISNITRFSGCFAPLFSHGGHGWDIRGSEASDAEHRDRVNLKTNDLTFGSNGTPEIDALGDPVIGPTGQPVWNITSADNNDFANSNSALNLDGRVICLVLARQHPTTDTSTKMGVRVRSIQGGSAGGQSQLAPITTEWKWYEYHVGQLATVTSHYQVRIYPGEPENGNSAAVLQIADVQFLSDSTVNLPVTSETVESIEEMIAQAAPAFAAEQVANFTAVVGQEFPVDVRALAAGQSITVTQPPTLTEGDSFAFFDSRQAAAADKTIVLTATINGVANDTATINSKGGHLMFKYVNAAIGLRIIGGAGI